MMRLLAVTIIFLSVGLSVYHHNALSPRTGVIEAAPVCNRAAIVAISPNSTSDLTIPIGASVSFNVSITNSCPISSFNVAISYNTTTLKPVRPLDYSRNVLGTQGQVQHECFDGQLEIGQSCAPFDQGGVISLSLYLLGNQSTSDPTSGLLFRASFNVLAIGTSQLHLFEVYTNNGGASVSSGGENFLVYPDTSRGDGFFANQACPTTSTRTCTPPNVNLVAQQLQLLVFRKGAFNSTGTRSTNPGGTITSRTWDWGDESVQRVNATSLTHIYSNPGNFTLTLTATDSYGVTASRTIRVNVHEVWIELSVGDVQVDHRTGVYAGAVIHIVSHIQNDGVFPENGTLTITLEGKLILNKTITPLHLDHGDIKPLSATWDTTGYATRVYRIDSIATPPPGANTTAHSIVSSYVQLIDPLPPGLQLSLAQTAGLGILVIGVLLAVASRFKKRPAWETEPL